MSFDELNNMLTAPRGGRWVKLRETGDKIAGELIDVEMINRTDPSGEVVLGKKSGNSTDKITQLGNQIEHVGDGLFMLKGSIATLRLRFMERLDCGDHWAWLAHVDSYENLREAPPLTIEELKRLKLILA